MNQPLYTEDEIVSIDPKIVKIKDGMNRFREDMGDLKDLVKSLEKFGQLQPIVVNKDMELMAGGRRLAACILGNIPVRAIVRDVVDPLLMREIELEENIRRKGFTPAEEDLAIAEIHRIKQSQFGASCSGRPGVGHTMDDTAKLLGMSRGSISQAISRAEMIELFPQLKSAKKKSEITKAIKSVQKLNQAMEGLKIHEDALAKKEVPFKLHNKCGIEFMTEIPSNSVDILLADPLYGIEAHTLMKTLGGRTGAALTSAGYKIEDCKEPALFFNFIMARESFRFTKLNAQGYVFCAPEFFWDLRQMYMAAGWRVHVKPIIWIKRETGQCNIPGSWPASAYEMIMYIRKDAARLVKEGMPDWIQCDIVHSTSKRHDYEKPVNLILNLLQRSSIPGQKLIDPCMGSGAIIEAATVSKLFSEGCDISTEAYAVAVERMNRVQFQMEGCNVKQN